MNKLARREYDYIKGNTVLAPERKRRVRKPDEKYKQIKRRVKKEALLRNQRKNDRKYLVTVAVVIFALGVATISGDNKVYSMQKRVSDMNNQIKQAQEKNDALNVGILKFSSLNNIEKKAEGNLGMYVPKKEEIVKVDFSDNYFAGIESNGVSQNTKENSIFSKLINLIK
ncbi:cell division protein FtsL [Clostridium saccharoperbutylacetonicum]|uniref:cell division protein FtsL n=1 Tax=Clostridium saccharoperbutylacetonicum TaxID=36745 RepID=UPI001F2999B8|nr:cell division protein FtsL [Clostridium saccharoperbutylacetonicum]